METATIIKQPPVSVIVATRNRGDSVVNTIKSILENGYSNFELLVIDQSDNDLTEKAVEPFLSDKRFHFKCSNTKGLSKAQNLVLQEISTEFVAITDDDCEVASDWISEMVKALNFDPKVGAVFGCVIAAEHNQHSGLIPFTQFDEPQLLKNVKQKTKLRGMGACMGLRRSVWEQVSYFDEMLGPGAKFKAAGDYDFAIKVILAGYYMYESPKVKVIHYGFRNWGELRNLLHGYNVGTYAMYAKYLKCGNWQILIPFFYDWYLTIKHPIESLIKERRIKGITQIVSAIKGFWQGLFTPVSRQERNFAESTNL